MMQETADTNDWAEEVDALVPDFLSLLPGIHRMVFADFRENTLSMDMDSQYFPLGRQNYDSEIQGCVTVQEMDGDVEWTLEMPIEPSSASTASSGTRKRTAYNKHTTRHDFVSEAISLTKTDVTLESVFGPYGDRDDLLSPDFCITEENGYIHFLEIATTRGGDSSKIKQGYIEKAEKYRTALCNRCHKFKRTVFFSIISIGIEGIHSTIPLSGELMEDMRIRLLIGIELESVGSSGGVQLVRDARETVSEDSIGRIEKSLESIKLDKNVVHGTLKLDEDFIKYVTGKADTSKVVTRFVNSWNRKRGEKAGLLGFDEDYFEAESIILTEMEEEDRRRAMCSRMEKALEDRQFALESRVNSIMRKFIDERMGNDRRSDKKQVSVMPLISVEKSKEPSTTVEFFFFDDIEEDGNEMVVLWSAAMISANKADWKTEDKAQLTCEAMNDDRDDLTDVEAMRRAKRKLYRRVDVRPALKGRCLRMIQKDGIYAKKAIKMKDAEIIDCKKNKKRPFSWTTDTSDIDEYLNGTEMFRTHAWPPGEDMDNFITLFEKAQLLTGNDKITSDHIKSITGTNLFRCMELISAISIELAISVKQSCSYGSMILKKLRYFDVYLLISPVSSRSHCFYSLFFPWKSMKDFKWPSLGPKLIETPGGVITTFQSVRPDKLENLTSMMSSIINLWSFWSWFYNIPMDGVCPEEGCPTELSRMLLLSLLVRMEDKAETEETITLTRYMYMEIFKSDFTLNPPDPFKICKKFSAIPRSRLNLHLQRKILDNFKTMCVRIPTRTVVTASAGIQKDERHTEDAIPGDEWVNLVNCLTGGPISNATQAVNLFYVGYLKNKNEIAQGNTEWNLLEKVLVEELSINDDEIDKSYGIVSESEDLGPKQFCRDSIMVGCEAMEERLRRTMGPMWKDELDREIMKSLSDQKTHIIASLKASSNINHSKMDEKAMYENKPISRVKVIEAVSRELDDLGLNPMENIGSILESIEGSSGGVVCDLFKKNQHGGLREIYVMTLKSRIVQLYIETISRVLCMQFEEETLTHPKNKILLLDKHKDKSAKESARNHNCVYVDLCSSSDKTRWSQNFVIPALSIALLRLTKKKHHPTIQRVLNLWCGRKVRIPATVLDMLMKDITLSSPNYINLKTRFKNSESQHPSDRVISQDLSCYVTLRTGFMQGILHYTSSLCHLSLLHAFKGISMRILENKFPHTKFMMSQVCSSDDSATMLSVFKSDSSHITGTPEERMKSLAPFRAAELILETQDSFCKDFCMKNSEKTTTAVMDYVEFNSEFIFRNTISVPTIKFVAAALGISESENYVRRFQNLYNLLSDLYSTGFPSYNTSWCQISQMLMHYVTMGLTTNPLFSDYTKIITKLPNHAHGFFYMDDEMAPGLMGYSYSVWKAVVSDSYLREMYLTLPASSIEVSPNGGIMESLTIKMGGLSRWHRLLIGLDPELQLPRRLINEGVADRQYREGQERSLRYGLASKIGARVKDRPTILFEDPLNKEDLKTKLLILASMPGVAGSLQVGNPFFQSLSMSLYSINTHCFTKTSLIAISDGRVDKRSRVTKKTSILLDVTDRYYQIHSKVDSLDYCFDSERFNSIITQFFPMRNRYEEYLGISSECRTMSMTDHVRVRYRKNEIFVQPQRLLQPLSLLETMKRRWFGHHTRVSESIYKECLDVYTGVFPWLQNNFSRTLEDSPFTTEMELFGFLASNPLKSRFFVRNGPGIHSSTFREQVIQLITKSFMSRKILVRHTSENYAGRPSFRSRAPKASMILDIPVKKVREKMMKDYMTEISLTTPFESIAEMSRREATLSLISLIFCQQITSGQLLKSVREMGMGCIWSYTKPQNKVVVGDRIRWTGDGELLVFSHELNLKLRLCNDKVTKIHTSNWDSLRHNVGLLRTIYKELGSVPDDSTNRLVGDENVVSRFNGKCFNRNMNGTPIYLDTTVGSVLTAPGNMRVSIRKDRVVVEHVGKGRIHPITEFKAFKSEIPVPENTSALTDIWDAWTQGRSLAPDDAMTFLVFAEQQKEREREYLLKLESMKTMSSFQKKKVYGMTWERERLEREISLERKDLLQWIKDTLSSRAKHRYGVPMGLHEMAETMEAEEELYMPQNVIEEKHKILMGMMIDDVEERGRMGVYGKRIEVANLLENERDISSDSSDDEEEAISAPHEMDSKPLSADRFISALADMLNKTNDDRHDHPLTIQPGLQRDYRGLHPLWDSIMNEIDSMNSRYIPQMLSGCLPEDSPKALGSIMRLLGIPIRTNRLREPTANLEQVRELHRMMGEQMDELTGEQEDEGGQKDPESEKDPDPEAREPRDPDAEWAEKVELEMLANPGPSRTPQPEPSPDDVIDALYDEYDSGEELWVDSEED